MSNATSNSESTACVEQEDLPRLARREKTRVEKPCPLSFPTACDFHPSSSSIVTQVQLHIHVRTRNREEAIADEDADEGCDNNFIIKRTTVQFVNRLTSAKSCTQQQPIQRKRTRWQERCGICGKGDTHITTKWICCDQCGQWYAYTCLKWGVAVASVAENAQTWHCEKCRGE